MNIVFVGDSEKHIYELSMLNLNPHDIFMSIMTFNKFLRTRPGSVNQVGEGLFLLFEGKNYLVKRYHKQYKKFLKT